MFYKLCASPIALAAATTLTLGSAAFGQTMVGTQEVSDADLPAVTAHCETLMMGAAPASDAGSGNADTEDAMTDSAADDGNTTMAADGETMDAAVPTDGTEGNVDAVDLGDQTPPDTETPTDSANAADGNVDADEFSGTVNLQMITMADCEAAGLGS